MWGFILKFEKYDTEEKREVNITVEEPQIDEVNYSSMWAEAARRAYSMQEDDEMFVGIEFLYN